MPERYALNNPERIHSPSKASQRVTVDELLSRLESSKQGLSSADAAERLQVHGANELVLTRLRSKVAEFLRAVVNPLVVILLIAGTASAFLGEVGDAVIIGSIVLFSSGLNFWQTFRSERAVKRLQQQIAPTATARRDGAWVEVHRREIVIGDVIRLAAGDLVPADARLFEADDLHVQQAALTGESLPAEKGVTEGALASIGPMRPTSSTSAHRS
jgi:Mg2+-importing ATPase